jgi:hypothetical protein
MTFRMLLCSQPAAGCCRLLPLPLPLLLFAAVALFYYYRQ